MNIVKIFLSIVFVIGSYIVITQISWLAFLGIFAMIWGNNLLHVTVNNKVIVNYKENKEKDE